MRPGRAAAVRGAPFSLVSAWISTLVLDRARCALHRDCNEEFLISKSKFVCACCLAASAIAATLLATGAPAFAIGVGHDAARRLKHEGKIVALGGIVADITARWPGRVIETGLERDGARYVYEIEVLGDDGHVYEFEYDATTGRRLDVERER